MLTNEHVVSGGRQFEVETPDGKRHTAWLPQDVQFGNYDLALLQFESPDLTYAIAKLAPSLALPVGTPVFAAGFPIDQALRRATTASPSQGQLSSHPQPNIPTLAFTAGRISVIPSKALERGYQFGYSNRVEKGMSGGPVLNLKGEVIAVNGMHAYPLWGDPYVFVDGSKPPQAVHEIMVASSFAIPMEVVLRLAPPALNLRL
ncbi:MAG: trypsin-like peptidase domain-containing protein [Acaryochloridaceae cyanobacterium SU_2_1]|nr:trypsin-like peptidase domain-containing protein [Acaryochloridaceae cyanobacterium SU_2_1]